MEVKPYGHPGKMETGGKKVLFGTRVGTHALLTVKGMVYCDCKLPIHTHH